MTGRTLAVVAMVAASPLGAQRTPDLTPYLIADRAAEIALARTAAPKAISDSATVLVLTRTGFVEAARGTNGFTCLVLRSFSARPEDPNYWNPRVRAPHCFNPPAVRTVLPASLKHVEWVMSGMSSADVAAREQRAYASHEFALPAAGAMAYMFSPKQHLQDDDPHWVPHLMFYYDKSLPAAAWGAGDMSAAIIDASAGDTQTPVRTLLIPVRRWSDGTAALPAGGR